MIGWHLWKRCSQQFKPEAGQGIIATVKNKLNFPVLGDLGNELARQFGIMFYLRQQRREFSKNVFKDDIAPRNARLNRSFPRCASSALAPMPASSLASVSGWRNARRERAWVRETRPLPLASAAGSGALSMWQREVTIRDLRRPVRIRLLAENGLKRPSIVLRFQDWSP